MILINSKVKLLSILSLISVVFTVALTFATLELPILIGKWLADIIPDIHPVIEPDRIEKFMEFARPIGYTCLGLIGILIVAGFITGKRGLSLLGSFAFFLPTFGYFLVSMFFLAGLGILRVPFIPFWDPTVNLINLGDISYLPYMAVVYPFWLGGIDVRIAIAWVAIGFGLFIFIMGTITWLYGKSKKRQTVHFWIYRYSRHPQYLGFIIWSYGVMLVATLQPVVKGGENPGASLPWLLTTLIIICIAFAEEISMSKNDTAGYAKYKASAPFLFPIPTIVSKLITAPIKLFIKKSRPENGRELFLTFTLYAVILVLLSLPFVFLNWPTGLGWSNWPTYVPSGSIPANPERLMYP